MKKIITSMLFALVAVLFVACTANSPKGVTENYLKALQAGDTDAMKELIYFKNENSEKVMEQFMGLMNSKVLPEIEKHGGIVSYEVTSENINENGETAKVEYKYTLKDGKEEKGATDCIKVDGTWMLDSGK